MKLKEARKAVLKELESKNLLIKKEKLRHAVNTHERCGTSVEYLVEDQWFVKILDLKDVWIKQADKMIFLGKDIMVYHFLSGTAKNVEMLFYLRRRIFL